MSSLAAARADNFYYPKDWDPSKGNINNFQKNKRKGGSAEEAKNENTLTGPPKIRFEMMFNVRCLSCKNSIGKGVRFNAKKKCIGQYLSTKIYEFSMNCHLCGNRLVIKTNPEKCDYDIVSGLEKRFEVEQIQLAGTQFQDKEVKKQIDSNPMYKLENVIADEKKGEDEIPRLKQLLEIKEANKEDYNLNSLLRKRYREKKKDLIEKEQELKRPKNFAFPKEQNLTKGDQKSIDKFKIQQSNLRYALSRQDKRENIRKQSIF